MCTFNDERTVQGCDAAIRQVRQVLTESFGDQVAYVHLDGEGTLVRAVPEVDAELFDARARAAIAAAQQGT